MPKTNFLGLTDEDLSDLEDLIGDGDALDEIMSIMGGEPRQTPNGGHTKVEVATIPPCDFCKDGTPAYCDGQTTFGPWGNMCRVHFLQYGVGLGIGKGQEYILKKEEEG